MISVRSSKLSLVLSSQELFHSELKLYRELRFDSNTVLGQLKDILKKNITSPVILQRVYKKDVM